MAGELRFLFITSSVASSRAKNVPTRSPGEADVWVRGQEQPRQVHPLLALPRRRGRDPGAPGDLRPLRRQHRGGRRGSSLVLTPKRAAQPRRSGECRECQTQCAAVAVAVAGRGHRAGPGHQVPGCWRAGALPAGPGDRGRLLLDAGVQRQARPSASWPAPRAGSAGSSRSAIGISAMLVVWLRKTPRHDWRTALPFALIIGGALGNLYDRCAGATWSTSSTWYIAQLQLAGLQHRRRRHRRRRHRHRLVRASASSKRDNAA
jgi:hypothetical protein